MLNRTHIAIGILSVIIFIPNVVHKWIFIGVFFISTLLPNIDKIIFKKGTMFLFSPLKEIINRDLIHSFTFCILVTVLLTLFWPIIAFPFFLGYALHLLSDSWTVEGIRPFWPLKVVSKGKVTVGGAIEETMFMVFVILDIIFALLFLI